MFQHKHSFFPKARQSLVALLAAACMLPMAGQGAISTETERADQLLIVDCLLPGKLRKLGRMTTYITARRPVKTTAVQCEIRGGEYTAYDRASFATALKVWLPRAQEGDAEAQNYVGHIYEKGLGLAPDHAVAAQWYRKAAEAGYTRAQINLGNMYEQGLGVERNPQLALQWYRKASGLEDAIEIDPGTVNQQRSEVVALREEIEQQRQQNELLRARLDDSQAQLKKARRSLSVRQQTLERERQALATEQRRLERMRAQSGSDSTAAVRRLEAELAQREQELASQQQSVAQLKQEIERVEREKARYRAQLTQAEQATSKGDPDHAAQLSALRKQMTETLQQLQAAQNDLAQHRRLLAQRDQLKASHAALTARRQEELLRHQAETQRLREEVERAQAQARAYEQRISQIETKRVAKADATKVAVTGPTIEIIDPELTVARGTAPAMVRVRSGLAERKVVGRVQAPAGLLSLVINDVVTRPNDHGVFDTKVLVEGKRTPVRVVAVDQQGKRAAVEFNLEYAETDLDLGPAAQQARAQPGKLPDVKFGKYYALVIGNNEYARLPKLKTAVNDADEVSRVLRERYGFETKVVRDASRYQILSALNEMREKLTKDDNLLIYYAGHGILDEVNMRGHWLPVDAEPDSSANWISNVAITDILNAMTAKQILLVVDSCYSGSLTRSALAKLKSGVTNKERENWLKAMLKKRSRTVLTSGGLKPVLDAGGGKHSVFAKAFLDVLDKNNDVMEGQRLYKEVSARVAYMASQIRFEQLPEYAPIRHAGHEAGDFFLVPKI